MTPMADTAELLSGAGRRGVPAVQCTDGPDAGRQRLQNESPFGGHEDRPSHYDRSRTVATDFPFPPDGTGTWRALSRTQRERWLVAARNRHFKWLKRRGGWKDADSGTIFCIDGSPIRDLPGFLCALGEAVNGPGGYFGLSLISLEDCLFGAFGVTLPFVLRIQNYDDCRRNLNATALMEWARGRIAAGDFHDDEGRHWLVVAELDGREGRTTLLDVALEGLRSHGVVIEGTPDMNGREEP